MICENPTSPSCGCPACQGASIRLQSKQQIDGAARYVLENSRKGTSLNDEQREADDALLLSAYRDIIGKALTFLSTPAQAEPVAVIGKDWSLLWASPDTLSAIVERTGIEIGSKLYAHPPAPTLDREAVVKAANPLLSKLDEALPHISNAILIATNHHCPYEGPQIDGEMEALRAALPLLAEDRGERS